MAGMITFVWIIGVVISIAVAASKNKGKNTQSKTQNANFSQNQRNELYRKMMQKMNQGKNLQQIPVGNQQLQPSPTLAEPEQNIAPVVHQAPLHGFGKQTAEFSRQRDLVLAKSKQKDVSDMRTKQNNALRDGIIWSEILKRPRFGVSPRNR